MQGVWWYLVGDSPQGPVSRQLLDSMLYEGTLTHESLVWKEGLRNWICVADLPAHGTACEEAPAGSCPADVTLAGPWRRFLARLLDLWILSLLAMSLALAVLPRLWPGFHDWIGQPFAPTLAGLLLFPLLLLVEAGIFAAMGNTPGKALLALQVATLDGQPLSGRQYLRRQLGVFWYGFAMGLPAIFLIAMASQGLSLRNGDPAAYDAGKYEVRAHRLDWKRRLWAAGTLCALLGLDLLISLAH